MLTGRKWAVAVLLTVTVLFSIAANLLMASMREPGPDTVQIVDAALDEAYADARFTALTGAPLATRDEPRTNAFGIAEWSWWVEGETVVAVAHFDAITETARWPLARIEEGL